MVQFAFESISAFAQTPPEEIVIPAVRPADDFYDAAGRGIRVRFQIDKKEVTTLEWFTLTLVIEKIDNPDAMTVPDLRKLSEFRERFDFANDPPKKRIDGNRCEIAYTVRVRDDPVADIPAFRFRYYLTGSRSSDLNLAFPLTVSESVPLTVRPREVPLSTIQPLEPAALIEPLESHLDLLATEPPRPAQQGFNLGWLVPPLLGVVWVWLWRWRYPDEAKLVRLRQSRAARRALTALHRSTASETTLAVFLDYLRERFGLEPWRTTPEEVCDGLSPTITDEQLRDEIAVELRETDRSRFGTDPNSDARAVRFTTLILELEEATR